MGQRPFVPDLDENAITRLFINKEVKYINTIQSLPQEVLQKITFIDVIKTRTQEERQRYDRLVQELTEHDTRSTYERSQDSVFFTISQQ